MMSSVIVPFLLGALFSFLGSIPPGTLNMAVLQLGLEGKTKIALRFAAAVAIVEYPYAWISVEFESWITSTPVMLQHVRLIAAAVLTVAGILFLLSSSRRSGVIKRFDESGFRKGMMLSILNPMVIPFWIAITAYLRSSEWLTIDSVAALHSYIFGASVGTWLLMVTLIFLSNRVSGYVRNHIWLRRIPGFVLLILGFYSFGKYLLM